MDKWQPIETAPKDGTEIIVGMDMATVWVVHVAFWVQVDEDMKLMGDWSDSDTGWWSYIRGSVTQEKLEGIYEPTHWMPLPKPPVDN